MAGSNHFVQIDTILKLKQFKEICMPTPNKVKELLDMSYVRQELLINGLSQAQLAKKLKCNRSSVAWVVKRYFSDAEQAQAKAFQQRKRDKISNK
jgi:predicted XRE-type DNA-binding protein